MFVIMLCDMYYVGRFFCLHPKGILSCKSRLTWPFLHVFLKRLIFKFSINWKKNWNINMQVSFLVLQSWKSIYDLSINKAGLWSNAKKPKKQANNLSDCNWTSQTDMWQSLKLQISRMFRARSSFTFRQL